ncbi:hypothetical protein [Iningainema tapete]|uniref:Uncharacterized protein n=1 Tax=Iningainema tapete BLCC-T55 TaxID=2748662 RepID=A0A8J7C0D6_9CYAN|nr:hypothetical protein [Iningainema tapete]MBD2777843.1 hypothetical protein [Iningainema tapete BLCC-T55]
MQSVIRYSTIVVVIHAIVVVLHGLAHEKIPVSLSPLQILFVGSIIVLAPIAAMILLWTPFQLAGSWLLLSSMAGAMLFGLYHHFIAISPDHISQVPFVGWGVLFQITAILLFFTEGLGCGVSLWALKTLQQREQIL